MEKEEKKKRTTLWEIWNWNQSKANQVNDFTFEIEVRWDEKNTEEERNKKKKTTAQTMAETY